MIITGEAPPTGGLPPRLADLFGARPEISLEQAVRDFTGAPGVVLAWSGAAALVTAFACLKRRSPRRTVIVSAYTCPKAPLAALQAGLKVVACDVTPGGLDLDLGCLARLIDADTLCVVSTHYGGLLTDAARVREIVANLAPDAYVVEDAAQAFGARRAGRSVGLDGHIGVFSFGVGKGFTLMGGGCVVSSEPELTAELGAVSREIAPYGVLAELGRSLELVGYHLVYNRRGLKLAYGAPRRRWLRRGDEIGACGDYFEGDAAMGQIGRWRGAFGARALRRLPGHLAQLRLTFDDMGARLAGADGVNAHKPAEGAEPNRIFRFVTFAEQARCAEALARLWASPLGVSRLFARAIGDYPFLRDKLIPAPTPNARAFAARSLTVTSSPLLGAGGREAVAEVIRWVCRGGGER